MSWAKKETLPIVCAISLYAYGDSLPHGRLSEWSERTRSKHYTMRNVRLTVIHLLYIYMYIYIYWYLARCAVAVNSVPRGRKELFRKVRGSVLRTNRARSSVSSQDFSSWNSQKRETRLYILFLRVTSRLLLLWIRLRKLRLDSSFVKKRHEVSIPSKRKVTYRNTTLKYARSLFFLKRIDSRTDDESSTIVIFEAKINKKKIFIRFILFLVVQTSSFFFTNVFNTLLGGSLFFIIIVSEVQS